MITEVEYETMIKRLGKVGINLAEQLEIIRKGMEGKGISPKDAPIVMEKLLGIEQVLRKLGNNRNHPVPF